MVRAIQVGVGPLGQRVVRYALERDSIKIVGAADPAPDKLGQDLGDLCGVTRLGIRVKKDVASAVSRKKADVALLTTVSSIKAIESQVADIARAGLDVVSTCEELTFPWQTAPEAARRIDAVCKKHGVTCVATGVNPGFLMDLLPVALTGVCQNVEKIVVERVQDASARRVPFQKKIGAGLNRVQFSRRKIDGTLRHVGLTESMHMIAHSMGWKLTKTTESLEPVIADRVIDSGYTTIEPGIAAGVEQIGRAYVRKRKLVIQLIFRAAVGEPESYDAIEVTGTPTFRSVIQGGINGDVATCAIVLNAIRSIGEVEPGLKTMLDLPPVAFSAV